MRAVSGLSAALFTIISPAAALAHGEHLTEVEGHSHWIALAALGAVGVIAFLAAWSMERAKMPKQPDASSDTPEG